MFEAPKADPSEQTAKRAPPRISRAPKSHLFGNSSARRLGAILTSSNARDKENRANEKGHRMSYLDELG
ncbi:MAG: hypothetical protein SPK07_05950, partial [Coriobacteriales bacterium]|nr:hypothetical protein [Coriobacteriales bacterium]